MRERFWPRPRQNGLRCALGHPRDRRSSEERGRRGCHSPLRCSMAASGAEIYGCIAYKLLSNMARSQWGRERMSDAAGESQGQGEDRAHRSLSRFVFAIGALIVAGFLSFVLWIVREPDIGPELKLPLVVILGVIILLIVIGLLTFGFSRL